MTVNVFSAFAVPFGESYHPGPAPLNAELLQLTRQLEALGAGYRNPQPVVHQPEGLFESEFDFFARPEPCVQRLRGWVWGELAEFIRNINPGMAENPRGLQIASQTWFHFTRDGGYFGYHNHPMASWSGVYCVADGDPSPDYSNNGSLVFPHPLTVANAFVDPTNAVLRWPYTQANYVLDLKPGQLLLFPSWLGHYVTPFRGPSERVTIAFNTWFQKVA